MKSTYHIITIGCQMNKSDSERIANYLENLGFVSEKDKNKADLVVLTTCGVRLSAENRIYGLAPKIKKHNQQAKIILTGCLSDREDVHKKLGKCVDIFLNIKDLHNLNNKLKELDVDTSTTIHPCDYLSEVPKYTSKISAYVPIGNGCNNFCSYCVVPYARGREVYRDSAEIIKEVSALIKSGYKEITLIAQNVNSYLDAQGLDFADLLQKVDDLNGKFWLRFSTSHPKDMSDKLIKTMSSCSKLCRHLHLPAQSGDDEILQLMNRKYKRDEYLTLIEKIRKIMPDITFSTDIIVGFPGETLKQFENTKKLFTDVKYDMAFISQYSPRPGTNASALEDNVSKEEKKRREGELMKLLGMTSFENNEKYLGQSFEVLVEAINKKGEWVGKNKYSKVIRIKKASSTNLQDKICEVVITGYKNLGLTAELKNTQTS